MRIATLIFFALISLSSYGQSQAVGYLDIIGQQYQKISHEMMTYTSAVNHGKSARKVEKRRTELMQQVKESETTVRRLKPFNGETKLRDSVVAYLRISNIVLNQDYGKIVDLEEVAEQSYDAMEAYLLAKEKAEAKLDTAANHAQVQYEAFAVANKINLIKNNSELSKKLATTQRVSQYSNKAYLLFFRSYKNEAYMMDAANRNDLTAIEQSRNALSASAVEDLEKSKTLGAFSGDQSLKAALQQILNFYKIEANDKMKTHSEYLIAKDNFEKIKKSMESTPQNKRTKENIDGYNKAADDFNKKVNALNTMHQDLDKKRNAALKNWNESFEGFLDAHTPKYK